jgi:uncharacterized protein YceH (UPF0502 family)
MQNPANQQGALLSIQKNGHGTFFLKTGNVPGKNRTNRNPVMEVKSETVTNTHNFILNRIAVNINKDRTINRHRMKDYVALTAGLG